MMKSAAASGGEHAPVLHRSEAAEMRNPAGIASAPPTSAIHVAAADRRPRDRRSPPATSAAGRGRCGNGSTAPRRSPARTIRIRPQTRRRAEKPAARRACEIETRSANCGTARRSTSAPGSGASPDHGWPSASHGEGGNESTRGRRRDGTAAAEYFRRERAVVERLDVQLARVALARLRQFGAGRCVPGRFMIGSSQTKTAAVDPDCRKRAGERDEIASRGAAERSP
jgi:hypothetical protein